MLTRQQRLELYKKALKDYTLATKWYGFLFTTDTDMGLCKHFRSKYMVYMTELQELDYFYPNTQIAHDSGWWFPAGQLEPRIEVLKLAIERAEKETTD